MRTCVVLRLSCGALCFCSSVCLHYLVPHSDVSHVCVCVWGTWERSVLVPWEIVILITHLSALLCGCVCVCVRLWGLRSQSLRNKANYTAEHFISFHFSRNYHFHILRQNEEEELQQQQQQCPLVGLKYLRATLINDLNKSNI